MWKFVIVNTVNKIGNVRINVTLRCVCLIIVFVESITYSKCVTVAFVFEHAVHMRRICHLRPLLLYHILLHYLRKRKKFVVKLLDIRGSADKSLARPGRKQATATKLGIYSTYSPRSSIHFLTRCSNFCKPQKI
jgi:hypothetical protein